jgi:hypothetical protein
MRHCGGDRSIKATHVRGAILGVPPYIASPRRGGPVRLVRFQPLPDHRRQALTQDATSRTEIHLSVNSPARQTQTLIFDVGLTLD